MYRLALGLTSSPELAEETVQEAGVKIMQWLDRLREFPPDELDKWLYVLVKNTALNLLRREKKYILTDEMPDEPIYDNVESQSSYNTLKSLIRSMPEGMRELLEMRFVLEYTNKEIAEYLGISENAVAARIHRARAKLIEVLRKEGYDYE
jgi:RNA polymerase sigma-70 factor (ECF subfamily)